MLSDSHPLQRSDSQQLVDSVSSSAHCIKQTRPDLGQAKGYF